MTATLVPQNPSSHQIFVGIDIGYKTHVACAIPGALFNTKKYPDGWRREKTLPFSSDASGFKKLQKYFDKLSLKPSDFLILCEPTGGYYGLALQMYLLGKGYVMLQVENTAVKDYREKIFGKHTKTDDIDARLMARMGFLHELVGEEFSIQPVQLASPDESIIKVMSHDLTKLTKEITRRRSQLHQILAFTFPELKSFFTSEVAGSVARKLIQKYPTPYDLKKASVEDITALLHENHAYSHAKKANELLSLAKVSAGIPLVSHHVWRQEWILSQLDMLDQAREDLLVQLHQLVAAHPYTKIIESFPVKSPIWTATLISVIGNINRFQNYEQFRAYIGWFPKVKQSGTSVNSSSLAPGGSRPGRKVLGQMALVLLTPKVRETPFRIYHERLVSRGMRPLAAVGHTAGKLASILYGCLKTQTPYDEMKHRKGMGIPTEEDTPLTIEIEEMEIDNLNIPDASDIQVE